MALGPDVLVGASLDDYQIVRLIGRGGMARVYEGYDPRLHRRVAIKVITAHTEDEDSEEITQRFFREARAVANLEHPNIVSVYRFGEGSNLYYMAMRLIEGHTLAEILKALRQRGEFMPPERLVRIASDVASALDYAHRRNVIHRDIKPSNIMLTPDDRAILMDFGLLMEHGANTTFGTAFGTPRYIAPEQAVASDQSVPQSDIYSLGVVLYEMAAGQVPFDGESPLATALSHVSTPPPPPRKFRPDLPEAVQTVLLRALEKSPLERWQTATTMVDALRDAYFGTRALVPVDSEAHMLASWDEAPVRDALPYDDGSTNMLRPSLDLSAPTPRLPLELEPGLPEPVRARRLARLPRLPRVRRRLLIGALLLLLAASGLIAGASRLTGGTAAPLVAPDSTTGGLLRLVYQGGMFAALNASGRDISIDGLTFARSDQSGLFEAARYGERILRAFPDGQCLQIFIGSADRRAAPPECGPQIAPQIVYRIDEQFWAPRSDADPQVFLVQMRGETIQTCSTNLDHCDVRLP